MKDKLEVGMYLRHSGLEGEFPIIQKITELKTPGRCGGKYKVYTDKCEDWFIDSDYIELDKSKYSFNIIDLLEPQDLMYIDIDPNDGHGGIVVPRVAETLDELKQWKKRLESGECKLVSITTHEQIEKMQYKVGGE